MLVFLLVFIRVIDDSCHFLMVFTFAYLCLHGRWPARKMAGSKCQPVWFMAWPPVVALALPRSAPAPSRVPVLLKVHCAGHLEKSTCLIRPDNQRDYVVIGRRLQGLP